MRNWFKLAPLFLLAAAAGCGNDNTEVVGVTPQPSPILPIGRIEYFLVAANYEGRALDVFRVDSSTGNLQPAPGSPVALNTGVFSLAQHPGQPFIYAAGSTTSQVLGFRMGNDGTLSPLPGLPQPSTNDGTVVLDNSGQFLYAPGDTSIEGFRVNQADGSLTHLAGFPLDVAGMSDAVESAFTSDDRYVFVTSLATKRIFGFALNQQTGALTQVSQTPTTGGPLGIRFDRSGSFLYVAEDNGTIESYSVTTNGTLSALPTSPTVYAPSGSFSTRFAFQDNTLFIGDRTSQTMTAFNQGANGQLTPVAGYPVSGGGEVATFPVPLTSLVYTGSRTSSRISGYRVATGGLQPTAVPGSPFATVGGTTELLPVVRQF